MHFTLNPLYPSVLAMAVLTANEAIANKASEVNQSMNKDLPVIYITSGVRGAALNQVPASLTAVNQETLQKQPTSHIEAMPSLAPNVNSSHGASRARFFQIRGIGERSQFIGPVNPSVGVTMDGIDMSNIGAAATLMDAQQVEVLRGPQGTLYGANALAGLIHIRSNDPTTKTQGRVETTLATYNTRSLTAAVGGPVNENVGYRVAIQSNRSDGFMENDYLDKSNTNNIDETFLRGKLRIQANDHHMLDLTGFYADVDNGYDAFSLDNNRHTLSDQPGHDRLESSALAVKSTWTGHSAFTLETSLSHSSADQEYGYDEDWAYPFFFTNPDDPTEDWGYNWFDNYKRDISTTTAEMRFISAPGAELFNGTTDWVTGVYYYHRDTDLLRQRTDNADFNSDYSTSRFAVYGQLESRLSDVLRLTSGLRFEQSEFDYNDSDSVTSNEDDLLAGGRLALEYLANQNRTYYALVSAGYKVGGVNADTNLPEEQRAFETESLWNYEVGAKSNLLDNRLQTQVALFYQRRNDAQIKGYRTISMPSGGTSFIDYIDNTDQAYSYGLEAEAQWQVTPAINLFGGLGLLETQLNDSGAAFDGRDSAQSPSYQFMLGAAFKHSQHWFSGIEVEGKDEFYFSDSHNQRSDSYTLVNAHIGYQTPDWSIRLWGRNLTNEHYAVRGFYFGNDPRIDWAETQYTQLGSPRQIGITAAVNF